VKLLDYKINSLTKRHWSPDLLGFFTLNENPSKYLSSRFIKNLISSASANSSFAVLVLITNPCDKTAPKCLLTSWDFLNSKRTLHNILVCIFFLKNSKESASANLSFAVLVRVADNIKYDINRKDDIIKQIKNKETNKGIRSDNENEMLQKVISSKKRVCQDYSILMNALLQKLGYTCEIVKGYTRNFDGNINTSLGHT